MTCCPRPVSYRSHPAKHVHKSCVIQIPPGSYHLPMTRSCQPLKPGTHREGRLSPQRGRDRFFPQDGKVKAANTDQQPWCFRKIYGRERGRERKPSENIKCSALRSTLAVIGTSERKRKRTLRNATHFGRKYLPPTPPG